MTAKHLDVLDVVEVSSRRNPGRARRLVLHVNRAAVLPFIAKLAGADDTIDFVTVALEVEDTTDE